MIKIIASFLVLSFAFAAGVVIGAGQNRPELKKIASRSFQNDPGKKASLSLVKKSPLKEKTTKILISRDSSNKFLNKKRTGYTVLLSSFKIEKNAESYAKKISKKGYDAFYFSKKIQGKTWHGVGVGSFSSKSTAESLKKQLNENRLGKGALISTIPKNNTL